MHEISAGILARPALAGMACRQSHGLIDDGTLADMRLMEERRVVRRSSRTN